MHQYEMSIQSSSWNPKHNIIADNMVVVKLDTRYPDYLVMW